jgi:hypothetical protein
MVVTMPDERRIAFNMGRAFPADDPVADFVVAASLAWNDLLLVNMRLVGGDEDGPDKYEVSAAEVRYLVRVATAHLHELRECIGHSRETSGEVDEFLSRLPPDALSELSALMDLNTPENDWIETALAYLRNQTFHYGAKSNWKGLRWALRSVADKTGEIVATTTTNAGTRLEFADLVAVQHFVKFGGDDAMAVLAKAVTAAIAGAIQFVMHLLWHYLNDLPESVVDWGI